MRNKLIPVLILALTVAVMYLGIDHFRLKKQLNEISPAKNGQVIITPVPADSVRPANPSVNTSPFDKPNVDPNAADFPPNDAPAPPLTKISFAATTYNFGRINEGDVVTTKFKFTNIGSNPLIIRKCTPSCGCTAPAWPRRPIQPGESSDITVQFDSNDKTGEQNKTVTVYANTQPAAIVLTIKALSVPKN